MRKIVHLSDIHFGKVDFAAVEKVVEKINEIAPDIVVVSGDLTQRAKSQEFQQAREFLHRLPKPQIVVPGNHDVPMFNVYDRFLKPLDKFQKYITDDLTPFFSDEEIAVAGVSTARSFTIKGGRINKEQVEFINSKFCNLDEDTIKIVVTHHPFDLPLGFGENDVVGRAKIAMPKIAAFGGDIFLAGHLHVSNIETTARRYKLENDRVAIVIQAGTATSVRVRGEANSFNLIEIDDHVLSVKRLECSSIAEGFMIVEQKKYQQIKNGWQKLT